MRAKIERNNLILQKRKEGKTIKEIAELFGISFWTCRDIVRGDKGLAGRDWKREQIRKYFNFTCQNCGKKWIDGERRFDVHHFGKGSLMTKKYDTGKIDPNMITLLCHKCHLNLPEHTETMSENHKRSQ